MLRYIVRRVLLTIPVLFGILTLVFFLGHVLPGDACRALLGERATDAICAAYNHAHGLDQPIPVQFGNYLVDLSHGDLGTSTKSSQSVLDLLIQRLPVTIELALAAMLVAAGTALLVAVRLASVRQAGARSQR